MVKNGTIGRQIPFKVLPMVPLVSTIGNVIGTNGTNVTNMRQQMVQTEATFGVLPMVKSANLPMGFLVTIGKNGTNSTIGRFADFVKGYHT